MCLSDYASEIEQYGQVRKTYDDRSIRCRSVEEGRLCEDQRLFPPQLEMLQKKAPEVHPHTKSTSWTFRTSARTAKPDYRHSVIRK